MAPPGCHNSWQGRPARPGPPPKTSPQIPAGSTSAAPALPGDLAGSSAAGAATQTPSCSGLTCGHTICSGLASGQVGGDVRSLVKSVCTTLVLSCLERHAVKTDWYALVAQHPSCKAILLQRDGLFARLMLLFKDFLMPLSLQLSCGWSRASQSPIDGSTRTRSVSFATRSCRHCAM